MRPDDHCRHCKAPLILRRIEGKNKTVALDAKPLDSGDAGLYVVPEYGGASKIEAGRLIPDGTRHRKHRCKR